MAVGLLCSQVTVTLWFWISSIIDQLVAKAAQSGPTATWLGGTVLFLGVTTGFQWTAMCQQNIKQPRGWKALEPILLFGIMALSTVGGIVTFLIYIIKRPGWTPGDSVCLATVVIVQAIALSVQYYQSQSEGNAATLQRSRKMHALLASPFGRMSLAISLRSIPRVFYGIGFFTAAFVGMSHHTVLSGLGIAVVRSASVLWGHRSHPCPATVCLIKTELIGNLGSQVLLSICWIAASIRMH